MPCRNGHSVGFSLQQFSEVLNIRDVAGQPYILIGGQAVNYWAERYLPTEPQLKPLQPFTSEDIDFKGGREDIQRIARQLELTPAFPHKVEMTARAGVIPYKIGGTNFTPSITEPPRINEATTVSFPKAIAEKIVRFRVTHNVDDISDCTCRRRPSDQQSTNGMTPSRWDRSPVQRRFDWPGFLEIRKRARQSAVRPNLYGGALNARNRLAASLRRPRPHRLRSASRFGSGRSVRPAISKPMANPNRSHSPFTP